MPAGESAVASGRKTLASVDLVRINDRVLNAAGVMLPVSLRALDAIHLATARQLGPELHQLITYDDRMAEGATGLGIRVVSPR